MYKVDKSKPVIIGSDINYESSCSSDSDYITDDSDTETSTKNTLEEIKGNFVFLNKNRKIKHKDVLKPESYIDED
tara:strand:+ start:127 stop:351 length:225 start_codon:yes stop_codon:yes gene_type:complete